MTLPTLYPWQTPQWIVLQKRRQEGRLAHAYLLSGIAGLGKFQFANLLAHSLFCTSPNAEGYPCQSCEGCHLFIAQTHPDWHPVFPEEAGKMLKIEQIRELVDISHQTAQRNGFKIILVHPADAMNIAAANALLKTLEEPGRNTLLLLVTDQPARLPITVRSRCQLLPFAVPAPHLAMEWLQSAISDPAINYSLVLKLAQGAPLQALKICQNNELIDRQAWFKDWQQWTEKKIGLMEITQRWQKADLSRLLFHLSSWVADVLRLSASEKIDQIRNQDFFNALQAQAKKIDPTMAYSFWDYVCKASGWVNNHSNLNTTLLLEDILLRWQQAR